MPAIVLIGAQWGDEGKGKATDILGGRVDYVVKPNGGNNAGHTVVVGGEKYELKLLPAGILSPTAVPVIGNGVVVNLEALFTEIEGLQARGDTPPADLRRRAPRSPYQQLDKVTERFSARRPSAPPGAASPHLRRQVSRVGIRVQDVFDESILRQKIEGALHLKNQILVKIYNRRAVEVEEMVEYFLGYADRLRPMVADTTLMLNHALERGESVLMEGGQSTMLDVDHGTTRSSPPPT